MAKNTEEKQYSFQEILNLIYEEAARFISVGTYDSNNALQVSTAALDRTVDDVTTYAAPCEITIVDLSTDEDVVVTASPAVLLGLYIDTVMSAHAALIKDGSTTKITLAASTAAGTKYDMHSASFATNITVESDDAATGKVAVFWRAA